MPAEWHDITAESGHHGDRPGSIWMLVAESLVVVVEPYRTGAPGGPFRKKGPLRLQYSLAKSDVPLKATAAPKAQGEALALVRAALEVALADLPQPKDGGP
jgi:hypothetical protein